MKRFSYSLPILLSASSWALESKEVTPTDLSPPPPVAALSEMTAPPLSEASAKADEAVTTAASAGPHDSMDESLGRLSRRIDEQKTRLQKQVRAYHSMVESPEDTPDLVFLEKDKSLPKKKAQALRMMELAIRYALEDLDRLEIQKSELISEIEWRRVQESAGTSSAVSSEWAGAEIPGEVISSVSRCQVLPVDVDPLNGTKILQDFGPREDAASGLKWESHGWWIGRIQSVVRACKPGKISYVGNVPGRGRVVILDHGGAGMTLYANLKDEGAPVAVKVGSYVSTGAILGNVSERLYFEVRQNGRAVSPREVFNSEHLAKLKL